MAERGSVLAARRNEGRDWPFVVVAVVAGLATFIWLDDIADALVRAWTLPDGLLVVVGWLPHAGFLLFMSWVVIRHRRLARAGKRVSSHEENVYGVLGMAWGAVGLALLGVHGYKVHEIDTELITDRVAPLSDELTEGLAMGQASWIFVLALAVGFLVTRLPFIPKPGWSTHATLLLLLWVPLGVTALGVLSAAVA